MMMEMTAAKIGRSMKKCEIHRRRAGLGLRFDLALLRRTCPRPARNSPLMITWSSAVMPFLMTRRLSSVTDRARPLRHHGAVRTNRE
jgi:hypothetical protein